MTTTFQKVWNFVLGEYKVRATPTASNEMVQHVILSDTAGAALASPLPVSATLASSAAIKIWDGTDTAEVESAATYDTSIDPSVKGLNVNSRNQQIFATSHVDNILASNAGDNQFYGQNQDQYGNLCSNLSSIRGTLIRVVNTAGTAPPPLPIGGKGVSSVPSSVTTGRAVDAYFDVNGRLCIFSDQTLTTTGTVAHDGADSGNPNKIGGQARQTNITPVSDGDRVNASFDDLGRMIVVPHQMRDLCADQTATITASTTATTTVTADANYMLDLVSWVCTNISSTGSEVQLLDDDGTTVRHVLYVPGNDTRGICFPVPLKQTAVNKAWKCKTVTSVTSMKITSQFVKNV